MSLKNGRYLKKIELEIENISPLNIGKGNGELLIDEENNKAYIPGTTLAGAIRNYIELNSKESDKYSEKLFGEWEGEKGLSKIFVYDSYADLIGKEVRPGVYIDRFSGATNNKAKFDRIYIGEGHRFKVNLEVYAKNEVEYEKFCQSIYAAINAINTGNITLGSYKTGGAGLFNVNFLKEEGYDFKKKEDLFAYLKKDNTKYTVKKVKDLCLKNSNEDAFVQYELQGELDTPLLVKGMPTLDYKRADDEQFQNINGEPIIPGTSIKGIVRNQGERILNFLKREEKIVYIFGGTDREGNKRASRFTAFDCKIDDHEKVSYSKIKIDRFTGGIIKGFKMEEQPIVGSVIINGRLKIDNKVKGLDEAIGLIALIFRDMARGELPIGSGSNLGRGRIKGKRFKIFKGNEVLFKWNLEEDMADINQIEPYIEALWKKGGN